MRYANIVPTGISHMSPNHDIIVKDLTIPTNTHVMPFFVELFKVSLQTMKDNTNFFSFTQGDYWDDGTTF